MVTRSVTHNILLVTVIISNGYQICYTQSIVSNSNHKNMYLMVTRSVTHNLLLVTATISNGYQICYTQSIDSNSNHI